MAFDLMVDDVDLDRVGGKEKVQPGSYHMLVESVDEDGGEKGEMVVELQILRGTTPNMEGKMYEEKFSKEYKEWPLRKLTAFAIAARLVTKEELKAAKASGKAPKIEWTQAVGRSICIELENNEYNGKTYTRLAWDNIWSPADKRASHVPLNKSAVERDKLTLPANRHIDGILAQGQATAAGKADAKGGGSKAAGGKAGVSTDDALDGVL